MKATFTYKEGPEKHVLPSFWHMQGQIYFFLKINMYYFKMGDSNFTNDTDYHVSLYLFFQTFHFCSNHSRVKVFHSIPVQNCAIW